MNKINREAIKSLLEAEDNATVSLYLPTHRFPTSEHIQEDKIRFKNLVRAGKEALAARGIDGGIIGQIGGILEDNVYDNDTFWQHTTEGLAVFCSPAGVQYFHLPVECEERASAGDRYDITPLLALTSCDRPYYLLALAVRNPVLYTGDMYGIERVDIELPESPEEALNIDETHAHSKTDRAKGYPGAKAHGQGDSHQAGQEEQLKFFRIVDEKIRSSNLVDENAPFLLAGGDDEVSGYRESSQIRHLLEASLSGNYTETPAHEIHAKAWPLVIEELCDKERAAEIEKVNSLLGTGKASLEAEDIAAAAKEGRVDTLLVGMLAATRDTVRDNEEPVTKLVFSDSYEEDGVGACGRAVFDQGGKVVGVLQDAMPNGASEAAVYRY